MNVSIEGEMGGLAFSLLVIRKRQLKYFTSWGRNDSKGPEKLSV